ncbi:MAG: Ig-like domain-containing protein [Actinomycetota bacterium]|nr:Ig-like domain-containing protein [Actinomycetota bacterium]
MGFTSRKIRRGRVCLLALAGTAALVAGVTPAAMAATISGDATNPNFFADPGEVNNLRITQTGNDVIFDDDDGLTNVNPACDANGNGDVVCSLASDATIRIILGDRDDSTTLTNVTRRTEQFGGEGNDALRGGTVDDFLDGGEGNDGLAGGTGDDFLDGGIGFDVLDGGAGDDNLDAGPTQNGVADGSDVLSGGSGIDGAFVSDDGPNFSSHNVSLDGVANDGIAGEGDNYGGDIENLSAFSSAPQVLTGSAGNNIISSDSGDDVLTGGAGNDLLSSGGGNDTLQARDGFADTVFCGDGNDTAVVDTLDLVSDTCENVQRADVGNANDDKAPVVNFVTPGPNEIISGTVPTAVTLTATDDKGVAGVVLIDDGVVVGSDNTAPYVINYQPDSDDVGANTLIAQAIDTLGQAGTALRNVRVGRITPRGLRVSVRPTRDRTNPYRFTTSGTLLLRPNVRRALGCDGIVSVQIKRGRKTVSNRRVQLSRTCTFRSRVTFRNRGRLGSGRLRVLTRFAGNRVLARAPTVTRNVRAGR